MRWHFLAVSSEGCKGQCASNADTEHTGRVTNDLQYSQLLSLTHIHTDSHSQRLTQTPYDSLLFKLCRCMTQLQLLVSISISQDP